jgi:hypothetical protein
MTNQTRLYKKFCDTKFCKISQENSLAYFAKFLYLALNLAKLNRKNPVLWTGTGSRLKSNETKNNLQKKGKVILRQIANICRLDPGHVQNYMRQH